MKCKVILILIFSFNARVEGSVDGNITNWKHYLLLLDKVVQSVWQRAGTQPRTENARSPQGELYIPEESPRNKPETPHGLQPTLVAA